MDTESSGEGNGDDIDVMRMPLQIVQLIRSTVTLDKLMHVSICNTASSF